MRHLKLLGSLFALLFCGSAFGGTTYYEECHGCDPGDQKDAQVNSIFSAYEWIGALDTLSIMDDRVESKGNYYVNWKKKNGTWLAVGDGFASQASSGGSGGGDGRTTVAVGPVIVLYPNPPTATVDVEGIVESGAGGGGCTPKTSPDGNGCPSLNAVNPGTGSSQ